MILFSVFEELRRRQDLKQTHH